MRTSVGISLGNEDKCRCCHDAGGRHVSDVRTVAISVLTHSHTSMLVQLTMQVSKLAKRNFRDLKSVLVICEHCSIFRPGFRPVGTDASVKISTGKIMWLRTMQCSIWLPSVWWASGKLSTCESVII